MKPVRPILTVHLMGGLGNQLFQYAFGRTLSRANEAELVLDASGYLKYGPADPDAGVRRCELQHFHTTGRIAGAEDSPTDLSHRWRLQRKAGKARQFLQYVVDLRKPYYLRHEIVEPRGHSSVFDARVCARTFAGSLSVRGFWQSEKYFRGIETDLRRELTWRSNIPPADAALAEMIEQTTSVAVHVRGGDYAWNQLTAPGVLPRSYYDAALRALLDHVRDARFFIFSDSLPRAQEMFGISPERMYVANADASEGNRDLRLMTLCKHHIIANSTLSWWGAWLGRKEGQRVFAPRKYWQTMDRPTPDLYPEDWLLL